MLSQSRQVHTRGGGDPWDFGVLGVSTHISVPRIVIDLCWSSLVMVTFVYCPMELQSESKNTEVVVPAMS